MDFFERGKQNRHHQPESGAETHEIEPRSAGDKLADLVNREPGLTLDDLTTQISQETLLNSELAKLATEYCREIWDNGLMLQDGKVWGTSGIIGDFKTSIAGGQILLELFKEMPDVSWGQVFYVLRMHSSRTAALVSEAGFIQEMHDLADIQQSDPSYVFVSRVNHTLAQKMMEATIAQTLSRHLANPFIEKTLLEKRIPQSILAKLIGDNQDFMIIQHVHKQAREDRGRNERVIHLYMVPSALGERIAYDILRHPKLIEAISEQYMNAINQEIMSGQIVDDNKVQRPNQGFVVDVRENIKNAGLPQPTFINTTRGEPPRTSILSGIYYLEESLVAPEPDVQAKANRIKENSIVGEIRKFFKKR